MPFFVFKLTIIERNILATGGDFVQKKSSKWALILCVIMMCSSVAPSLVYGSSLVHNTIRVGLRSAYNNVGSVEIKNTGLDVGYEQNNRFISQGTLSSSTGFAVKASEKQYYTGRDVFSTYNEAVYALLDYKVQDVGAVVAYVAPGIWRIYSEQNLGNMSIVKNTGLEVIIQDGFGMPLLVCENNGIAPVFVGKGNRHSFDLTELTRGLYRGWFEFVRQGNTITAVNIVDYEEYLYGVIASEMPASWNMEALKAQAVVARSMSVYQYNKYIKNGYNVCDTTYTQVYKGFSGEHERTNQAVDETQGIIVTYNGKIAETLFFSTSGGYTEDPQYVWGNPVAYLKAVPDLYETEPEMKPWTRTITLADIDLCLQKQNINIGEARGMRINYYTPAGRVNELQIIGSTGVHTVVRENIRTFFTYTKDGSLRSRMFTIGNGENITPPSGLSESLGQIVIYEGGLSPEYIIGLDGKVQLVGDSLVAEGSNGKITYGYGNTSKPSNISQEQYGDIIISGRGFGHGVGMSQSGARGMAKEGYTYNQIIQYYYQGVELQK